jgi:hypothetical protein
MENTTTERLSRFDVIRIPGKTDVYQVTRIQGGIASCALWCAVTPDALQTVELQPSQEVERLSQEDVETYAKNPGLVNKRDTKRHHIQKQRSKKTSARK